MWPPVMFWQRPWRQSRVKSICVRAALIVKVTVPVAVVVTTTGQQAVEVPELPSDWHAAPGQWRAADVVPEGISGRGQAIRAAVDGVQKHHQILTLRSAQHRLDGSRSAQSGWPGQVSLARDAR